MHNCSEVVSCRNLYCHFTVSTGSSVCSCSCCRLCSLEIIWLPMSLANGQKCMKQPTMAS